MAVGPAQLILNRVFVNLENLACRPTCVIDARNSKVTHENKIAPFKGLISLKFIFVDSQLDCNRQFAFRNTNE